MVTGTARTEATDDLAAVDPELVGEVLARDVDRLTAAGPDEHPLVDARGFAIDVALVRALGGGFVEGSATLIGGDPGIGKSTEAVITQALSGQRPDYLQTVEAKYPDRMVEGGEQVRAALASGAKGVDEVVEIVYADVDRSVWSAAAMSVRAQLAYLTAGR